MAKWILLLLACAAVVWRLTRPGGMETPQLVRCDKCGVHHAKGEPCDCAPKQ